VYGGTMRAATSFSTPGALAAWKRKPVRENASSKKEHLSEARAFEII
jgi:hypothetical protein